MSESEVCGGGERGRQEDRPRESRAGPSFYVRLRISTSLTRIPARQPAAANKAGEGERGFTTDYDAMEAELAKKAGKTLTPAGADIPYFMQMGELAAITVYSYA